MKSWAEYFLDIARAVSSRSKDPSTKVGAVATDASKRIVETGYNGLPRKVRDLPERMERPAKYLWTSHAEENLVAHAARDRLEGTTVYCTNLPCCRCARLLINAGVKKIIYASGTTAMDPEEFEIAKKMFEEADVVLFMQEEQNV